MRTRSLWIAVTVFLVVGAIGYLPGCGEQPSVSVVPAPPTSDPTPQGASSEPTLTPPPTPTAVAPTPQTATAAPPTPQDASSEPTLTPPPTPTAVASTPQTVTAAPPSPTATVALWRGLRVNPENRCAPYDADDYPYSQSVENGIVAEMGGIYGPYTGHWFGSTGETDIEHMVARSEAHDSGLCAADSDLRHEFANDLLNLTLAAPAVNRHQKSGKDAAEWLPDLNQCWFADRVVRVRLKYDLTIDRVEADALERVLADCTSTQMIVTDRPQSSTPTPQSVVTVTPESDANALELWDDDNSGRITCAEARVHGIAPVHRDHPAYQYMTDRDDDGVVCE